MTEYYKYYLETKNRFSLSFLSWVLVITVCYYYKETLLFFFIQTNKHSYFIFTNITEIFYVYLNLTFFIANQILSLSLIYHSIMFLALSLYKTELLKLKYMFKLFIGAWLIAILFFIKIILPFSWSFFLGFQTNLTSLQQIPFIFEAKIEEYYQFFVSSYYTCLLSCQFLIFLISFLTSFTKKFKEIKKFRKFFYLIFVVFSTLITPPDIISQLLISLVLILIYEFLIFMKCLRQTHTEKPIII